MSGEKLAACPFCGGEAKLGTFGALHYVTCSSGLDCDVGPETFTHRNIAAAVAAWNTRSPDPVLRELRLILTDIVNRGHVDRAVAARETLRIIDGLEVLHGRRTP